jgi:hypothetical protein
MCEANRVFPDIVISAIFRFRKKIKIKKKEKKNIFYCDSNGYKYSTEDTATLPKSLERE